jgi:hypothetical protein
MEEMWGGNKQERCKRSEYINCYESCSHHIYHFCTGLLVAELDILRKCSIRRVAVILGAHISSRLVLGPEWRKVSLRDSKNLNLTTDD